MGNSAMKCCPCIMGRTVNVVLLSGETAEFREPVRASTVMKRYPQHVVLQCSMANKRGMGQHRNIAVLKPEQSLKRNQNYLITPIQTAGNSKPFLDSWAFFTLSVANRNLDAKIRKKTRRRSWIQTVLDKIFGSPRSYHSLDDDDDDDDNRPSFGFNQPSLEPRKSSVSLKDRGPSLESIAESPTISRNSSFVT